MSCTHRFGGSVNYADDSSAYKIFNLANQCNSLEESPSNWSRPTPQALDNAIVGATAVIKAQKGSGSIAGGRISGALCEIEEINKLVVLGDIHGDYECLEQVLRDVSYDKLLSDPRNKLVFLGDYVDRGDNSAGVLNAACQLKTAYPDSVVLMRGNHEAPAEFPFYSHDFPFELAELFGESAGKAIYQKALVLFRELSVATIVIGRILLVHGGLPTEDKVIEDHATHLSSAPQFHMRNRVLEQILWNDPREIAVPGWEDSSRGIGRHFGPEITKKWLNATGVSCIVRGHEPCQGFRLDHEDKMLTLFTSRAPYPSFRAAYIIAGGDELQEIRDARDLARYVKFPA